MSMVFGKETSAPLAILAARQRASQPPITPAPCNEANKSTTRQLVHPDHATVTTCRAALEQAEQGAARAAGRGRA